MTESEPGLLRANDQEHRSAPVAVSAISEVDGNDKGDSANETCEIDDDILGLLKKFDVFDSVSATAAGIDLAILRQAVMNGQVPIDTLRTVYDYMASRFLDSASGQVSGSLLETELQSAVREQYGDFGLTVDQLKLYLETAMDIEDAVSQGQIPKLNPERYKAYKKVHELINHGPARTEEQEYRLEVMVRQELLSLPWPSTMVRAYRKACGEKLRRMKKRYQSLYDQVLDSHCDVVVLSMSCVVSLI
jgi:hypothetical protein